MSRNVKFWDSYKKSIGVFLARRTTQTPIKSPEEIRDLFPNEHHFNCFTRYVSICEKSLGVEYFPITYNYLWIQLCHSSLYPRLLRGLEPLEKPPPKSYSRPWYSIIENQKGESSNVFYHESWEPHINIEGDLWLLETIINDKEFVVKYPTYPDLLWSLKCVGSDDRYNPEENPYCGLLWELEVIS